MTDTEMLPYGEDDPSVGREMRSREVLIAQNTARAIELRSEGHTYGEIGQAMGMSANAAAGLVKRGLNSLVQEPAEELRRLEAHRIERMWKLAFPKSQVEHFRGPFDAMDTQGEWFDRCIRLMERRAKLLGLDAATEISFPELRAVLFAALKEHLPEEQYQKVIAQIAET